MNKSYHLRIFVILLSLLWVTCSSKINLMETIKINTGDTITQRLDGNASTGYSWMAVVDNPRILSVESAIITVNTDAALMGAPNVFEFKVKGKSSGTTKIHFEYRRPWETNVAPKEIRIIEIEVMAGNGR